MNTFENSNLSKSNIAYFNNINQVAKDFKKILVFFGKRELSIFKQIDNIKHNHLLYSFSKSLGYSSYRQYESSPEIKTIDITSIKNEIALYLKSKLSLQDDLISEISYSFFYYSLVDEYQLGKDKTNLLNKIKKRLEKLQKIHACEDGELSDEYWFCHDINLYLQAINKVKGFILNPNYLNKFLKLKIDDKEYQELKDLLPEYIIVRNLLLLKSNPQETHFLQINNPKDCVDSYIYNSFYSKEYHCGLDMSGSWDKYTKERNKYLSTLYGEHFLSRIIIEDSKFYRRYSLELNKNEVFFYFDDTEIVFNLIDEKGEQTPIFHDIDLDIFRNIHGIECFMNFNGIDYEAQRMKKFFIPKNEQDHLKIDVYNDRSIIATVYFYLTHIIIDREGKKERIPYKELYSKLI